MKDSCFMKYVQVKHPRILLMSVAALILFAKNIYFHAITFGVFPEFSSGMGLTILKFYIAKLLCPIFLSFILLISYRTIWMTACMFLADLLCIANVIYFKSYDMFLTINSITLVGNMDGAWTSLEAYLDARLLQFPFLTVLWIILSYKINLPSTRNIKALSIGIGILFLTTYLNNIFIYDYTDACGVTKLHSSTGIPFTFKKYCRFPFMGIAMHSMDNRRYVYEQSILSYFPSSVASSCKEKYKGVPKITPNDFKIISPLVSKTDIGVPTPSNSIIIILVESLESWVLHTNMDGVEITPFLNRLTCQNNVLYCNKIKSQALAGNSGDGQMIINTGLLPTTNGVACMDYDSNIYPNIAGLYSESATINPWPHIWNQTTMCKRYGYCNLVEPKNTDDNWQDADVLTAGREMISRTHSSFCLMNITISSHTPFDRIQNNFPISSKTPELLRKYMSCINYTDKCIEEFFASLNDSILYNTTIVITGDHTIFKPAMLNDYKEYAISHKLSIANEESYCPLIICSPYIDGNFRVDDICYQMDIFPTMLHLIDCGDYYWHGLGVNILDENARQNRGLIEQEAYRISDLMIRNDYFRKRMSKEL